MLLSYLWLVDIFILIIHVNLGFTDINCHQTIP